MSSSLRVVIGLIGILSCVLSCSHIWTYKFTLDEDFSHEALKGWRLEPDIFSVVNIIADSDSLLNKDDYIISLKFLHSKKTNDFYDITIDTLHVSFYGAMNDTILVNRKSYYYGFASYKEMHKNLNFIPISDTANMSKPNIPELHVPDHIDSMLFRCDAVLREGYHITYYREDSKIERDSIAVDSSAVPIREPLEVKLHKYRMKGRALDAFSTL